MGGGSIEAQTRRQTIHKSNRPGPGGGGRCVCGKGVRCVCGKGVGGVWVGER